LPVPECGILAGMVEVVVVVVVKVRDFAGSELAG
jgi:hypothetical protein